MTSTTQRVAMLATRPMTYATRRLLPGDMFDAASERQARVLQKLGKAEMLLDRHPKYVAPVPKGMKVAEIDRLRDMARSAGLKVDRRFGEARLREMLGL